MGAISGSGLSLGTLWIAIEAQMDEAIKEFQKFGQETSKIVEDQKKKWESLKTIGENLSKVGASLTAGLTLPLAGIGAASIKAASDFEASMNKVAAQGEMGAAEIKALSDAALQMGADTQFSAQQAADGMADLASAGFKTNDILKAMPGILNLAAAGQISIAQASETATDTLAQFEMGVGESGRVADVLTKAASESKASVAGMGQALNYVGAQAHSAGIPLEDTAAALAILSNGGRQASQAGTDLRGVMASLLAPSKDAQKTLSALGVTAKDSTGHMKPLNKIFMELKKSGADATDMFEIFGRENATAATILTNASGPALAAMTKKIQDSQGAAQAYANTLNKGMKFGLEQFKGSVETTAIALGTALAPAFNSLMDIGVKFVNWLSSLIKQFGELPSPVKTAVLAFVGFAAAIGPLIGTVGLFIQGITMIAPALATMAKALGLANTGALVPFGAKLGILVTLSAIAAQQIHDNWDELSAFFSDIRKRFLQNLVAMYEMLQKVARTDYSKTIQDLNHGIQELDKTTQKHLQNIGARIKAEADMQDKQRLLTAQSKQAEAALAELNAEVKAGTATIGGHRAAIDEDAKAQKEATKAQKEAEKAAAKLTREQKAAYDAAQKLRMSVKEIADQYDNTAKKLGLAAKKLTDLEVIQRNMALAASTGVAPIAEFGGGMAGAAAKAEELTAALKDLGVDMEELPELAYTAANAMKSLGITSAAELRKAADEARRNYEIIEQDGTSTPWEIQKAWVAALAAEKAAIIALTGVWTAEQEKILIAAQKTLEKMEGRVAKTESIFKKFGQEISRTLASAFADIGKRLIFGGDDTNKQLDEQEAALRTSLAERAGEWEQYAADVAREQAGLSAQLAADLQAEEDALAESLAGREQEYQDAVAEILQSTKDLAGEQADEMREAREDAADELDEQVRDYEQFADDVDRAIRDLGEKYADQVAEETEDLRRELRDRGEDYDDFVRDVNTKLSRIGQDTQENIADETRDTADNIAERTRDYNRYAEDVAADIAELRKENKGQYSKEEGDLVKSLNRKKEDLDQYIYEQNKRLDRYTRDQKENQREEEQDLQTSLTDRTEDYQTFLKDRNADYDAAVAGFKEAHDQEVAEQVAALAEKEQALETFKTEQQTRLDELALSHQQAMDKEVAQQNAALVTEKLAYETFVTDAIAESDRRKAGFQQGYEDDTAALATELGKAKAEYEKFVTDITGPGGELEKLKSQHKTIWDDIGAIGKGAIESITQAMLRLASEEVLGNLMNKLAGMKGILGDIGEALGGVADKVSAVDKVPTPGGPPTPSAPSGPSGVGSAVGAGLSGWIGAISGAVTAISSVISNFQFAAMNKSLDLIVNHTLRIYNETENMRRDHWTQYNHMYDRLGEIWRDLGTTMDKTAAIANDIHLMEPEMAACARSLDAIAGPQGGEASRLDRMLAALDQLVLLAGERTFNISVNGSDPATVGSLLMTRLRLQGGFA